MAYDCRYCIINNVNFSKSVKLTFKPHTLLYDRPLIGWTVGLYNSRGLKCATGVNDVTISISKSDPWNNRGTIFNINFLCRTSGCMNVVRVGYVNSLRIVTRKWVWLVGLIEKLVNNMSRIIQQR